MKFAVQLVNGTKPLMANVIDCFQGDFARIRQVGDEWFLESSLFEACTAPVEVFPIADKLLRLMHRFTAVYGRLFMFSDTGYAQEFSDEGVPLRRALRATTRVQIYVLEGLQELQVLRRGSSVGSALVARAATDARLQEALALIGDVPELQWAQVYNILEFLGGVDAVTKKKWATREQVRKCRETANHHRHLGSPKKYPLPANPPTIGQATILVFDLLRKWIAANFPRE